MQTSALVIRVLLTFAPTQHFESGFPHGFHQFSSFAGTAWATMALMYAAGPGTA